jgi:hypothetical protein
MFRHHFCLSQALCKLLFMTVLIGPAVAHEVEVSNDVAATFHIEPDHTPKAGKPSLAWFALTKKGGKIIPLEQCNCKLTVHLNPHKEGTKSLLEPPLKAVSADRYQGIPGAEIVFPKAGSYELELSGTPKAGANFQPFELPYTVTVGAGTAATVSPTGSGSPKGSATHETMEHPSEADQKPSQSVTQWQSLAAVGAIGLGAVALWLRRPKR